MFEDGVLTPSGVRLYSAVSHNIAGFDPTDADDPQVRDLLKKYSERGRELFSENSEDALTWSLFHALSQLPSKDWLVDFFRVAVNDSFAKKYSPHVHKAEIRFWQPYPAPKVYLEWLRARILRDGEAAFAHIERYEDRVRAKRRYERILRGDDSEFPERPTEVDVQITIGQELQCFIEVKNLSDLGASGTFAPTRNQLVRNLEQLAHYSKERGFKDCRFILLTLDRLPEKLYTKMMRRYRSSDMRLLRQWDQVGNWQALKADLPHRDQEPDSYFQEMSQRMGWCLFQDLWKLLAHYCLGS